MQKKNSVDLFIIKTRLIYYYYLLDLDALSYLRAYNSLYKRP